MEHLGLDDTLHAVVQVTHEHGLPLTGADVHPGRVMVFTEVVDLPCWVRWLTDPAAADAQYTVWVKESVVAFVATGVREGIEWCLTDRVPNVLATSVLDEHGITVTEQHQPITAEVAVALTVGHATDIGAHAEPGERAA